MKKILFSATLLICAAVTFAQAKKQPEFITVSGLQFLKDGKPYYYIGANYWYGAILGSEKYGDHKRLVRELDQMKENGIDNLRILAGADGGSYDYTVPYALQTAQGKYDQDLLEGLDFLLWEMGKRKMYAVLYLTNNWEWSGGMSQYLQWNGRGDIPNPNLKPENTWENFMAYVAKFHSCEPCTDALKNHIRFIISRVNTVTKKKYTNDPAIMAWQVANEPRIFTAENEKAFTKWLNEAVDLIDSLDKNHLICTGSEGSAGSNADLAAYQRTHDNPKIDYLTMHIWPKNWNWYKADNPSQTLPVAISKAQQYMEDHILIAKTLNKPIVVEEFGLPREKESLLRGSPTNERDIFYRVFFEKLTDSHQNGQALAGVNFWGYGGEGKASDSKGKWNKGDAFTADPPMEPQGLNTVFSSDKNTLELIKQFNSILQK